MEYCLTMKKNKTKQLFDTLSDLDGLQGHSVVWKKASLKSLYSLWFHLYNMLEKATVTVYKSVATRELEEAVGTGWGLNIKRQHRDFPGGAVVKNPPANAGDTG